MYSDSSSAPGVYEDFSSDGSISDAYIEMEMENYENIIEKLSATYHHLFEDPEGPFRVTFPDLFAIESTPSPFLHAILNDDENESDGETKIETPIPSDASPSPLDAAMRELSLRPSPATRFLAAHPDACLLIAVAPDVTRALLRERHASALPGVDFAVAYTARTPAGWALPLSRDPDALDALRRAYPTHRPATEDDVRLFARERRGAGGTQTPPKPKRPAGNRRLAARLRNRPALEAVLAELGGPHAAVFVPLDMEAALVLRGNCPLPVELALLPVGAEVPALHAFLHPGAMEEETTPYCLSCGSVKGSHGVPFRNAKFLRRDYDVLAAELQRYMADERVIFVNKDSTADVHAMRWVFAAAQVVCGSDVPIPSAFEICCFDIQTVELVLADFASPTGGKAPTECPPCWYHDAMTEPLSRELLICENMHCALRDANDIRQRILSLL